MSIDAAPFTISIGDEVIADLHDRLDRTRWTDAATVDDWSQGAPLAYVQDMCRYWRAQYDWTARQAVLNRYPQFTMTLDGEGDEPLDVHFVHLRSSAPDATPLILTHGWPGSFVEFLDVVGPLTDPAGHGAAGAPAFHVVVPSLPGFGFSGRPRRPGWGVERIATAWDQLMVALGYDRYYAQGGDWGAIVTTAIGIQARGHCAGIHVNMPVAFPTPEDFVDATPEELAIAGRLGYYDTTESGYAKQQATRPQSLGYGLVDSPVAQAAWILEKFYTWTDNDGAPEDAVDRDRMLDNVMVYWLTATATSSARLYWESMGSMPAGQVLVPSGISQFPKDIIAASRRWSERVYADLRYWNVLEQGGHFAAMEEPDLFVAELRAWAQAIS